MGNRQQRRSASKLQQDPKIKRYVDNFAMDLSKILVDHFDKKTKGEQVDLDFDEQTKNIMRDKGGELGNFVQEFMKNMNKDFKSENNKVNIKMR